MVCQSCGNEVASGAQFCQNCGAPTEQPKQAEPPPYAPPVYGGQPYAPQPVVMQPGLPVKRRSVIKIILVIAVVGILIFVGGIVAIFFGARSLLKNSDANKAAVQALRESPSVSRALGDIRDIGTPMGNISTGIGGSGSADLSMSVEGSRGSGRYYATLERRSGKWFVLSGRVDLRDGRSVNLEGRNRGPGNF